MKQPISIIASALAAVMLAGCSDELSSPSVGHNCVIEAETMPVDEPAGSRTAYDPTDYTSGQIGINWLPGDSLGVFSANGSENAIFTNAATGESASTTFSGNMSGTPAWAYYPYSATAGTDPTALRGTLPATQHYSTATRALEADWKVGSHAGGNKFKFEHLFAFLRFEVNADGSTVKGEKLESITLTIPGTQLSGSFTANLKDGSYVVTPASDTETMTMEWTDQPELSEKTFYGFMTAFPANIAGKDITISITTSKHTADFTVKAAASEIKANAYYTLPVNLAKYVDDSKWAERQDQPQHEQAQWKPGLESSLACANTVFGIPGQEFMHKIRVADNTQTIEVYHLPEGLKWNAKRKLVYGIAPTRGDYEYTVVVKNADSTEAFAEGIRLYVRNSDELAQPTPHMGWQSWNVFEEDINEEIIKQIAKALVDKGFAAVGYDCVGIDDCWQLQDGGRDANGVPVVDSSKFPDFKALTDYIHGLGLKAGIYSDAGTVTCASKSNVSGELLAAYGYEDVMARQFKEWGFDKLKEDWFWSGHGDTGDKVSGTLDASSDALALELYGKMGNNLLNVEPKVSTFILSMCEWGIHKPWKWGAETGASSWRISYDARDAWNGSGNTGTTTNRNGMGLRNSIDWMRENNLGIYSGINRFNDMDMLCVGIRGKGNSSSDAISGSAGMSDDEYETNFIMWCMHSSPLLITCDVRNTIDTHDFNLLTNKDLIDINQDPLGQGAELIKTETSTTGSWLSKKTIQLDYYMKDLAGGDVAIAVVNLGEAEGNFTINLSEYDALDAANSYTYKELVSGTETGTFTSGSPITGTLAKHATRVYRVKLSH